MANTVRANWTTWVAGSQTDDPRIGVNGDKNNIMRYQFTTGTSGASHLSFSMGYTRLYDGSYIDICWYVGTSATSHTNANKAQGSASHGTVKFDSNHHSFTIDADINLSPSTTYYLWLFPAVTTYGFYSGSRADSDNDLTLSGTTKYTVSYNANGGTGAPSAQTKSHGTALTLSSTKPTLTGYTFKGWGTSANDTSVDYAAGASYTSNASITLYAIWQINTYDVSYDANGGSNAPAAQTKTYGKNLTLSTTKPTRAGHTFQGWGTSASDTTVDYAAGATYSKNEAITLYAIWKIDTYVVSYDANGGSGAPSSQTKTYGKDLTLSTIKPTKANAEIARYTVNFNAKGGVCSTQSLQAVQTAKYAFSAWNTKANGSGTSYAAGETYKGNSAMTLYAQYSLSTSTTAITLPTPTRDGHEFLGWATSATAESGITGSYTPSSNVTLYAIWKANGLIYRDTGTGWEAYQIYRDTGSGWELYALYRDTGTGWEMMG